ncbi:MAG: SPFH domain-containing protein [Pseudomonadota bacterium]
MAQITEHPATAGSGYVWLAVNVVVHLLLFALFLVGIGWTDSPATENRGGFAIFVAILGTILMIIMDLGFFTVHPNEAKVLQLFGKYVGTVHDSGLRYANPLYAKQAVSLRVRNFESGRLKVNDADGSPIEIAAVVVWRVVDTAEAVFEVDNYEEFVQIQSEAALRVMTSSYPYESNEDVVTLRGDPQAVAESLKSQVQERLQTAGVEVIEARISHLAYAPEIASAMLRRQQAGAILAARERIVEGAVSMVDTALDQLSKRGVVELDEERRAAMVSNLMVVLCADQETQPVINTGTLHTG